MSGVGKRAGWSHPYVGDRPRDVLGLTKDQEATISQFIGFFGKDEDDNKQEQFILRYDGTDAPTLTNYASTPIGTVIIAPKLATPTIYIHKAQSEPGVVGDWYKIAGVQAT